LDHEVRAVVLADGETIPANRVVVTTGPAAFQAMVPPAERAGEPYFEALAELTERVGASPTAVHLAGAAALRPRARTPIAGVTYGGPLARTGLLASPGGAVRAAAEAVDCALQHRPSARAPSRAPTFVPLARLAANR
jgi:hypothetical protein